MGLQRTVEVLRRQESANYETAESKMLQKNQAGKKRNKDPSAGRMLKLLRDALQSD